MVGRKYSFVELLLETSAQDSLYIGLPKIQGPHIGTSPLVRQANNLPQFEKPINDRVITARSGETCRMGTAQ